MDNQTPEPVVSQPVSPPPKQPRSLSIKLDARLLCVLLLIIIAVMLGLWRPWQDSSAATDRKLTVQGSATVKSEPDEFVFYPEFSRTGTDLNAMKNELNAYGSQLNDELKELGVKAQDIKLDSSSYDNYYYRGRDSNSQTIYLMVTIKVPNKEMAQKVQDYLANTDASGQLTAYSTFSDGKLKKLESEARQKAIDDARAKAEQSARNLDSKVGKVLEVKDSTRDYGLLYGARAGASSAANAEGDTASLPVTPGTDEVTGSVQVVFALR